MRAFDPDDLVISVPATPHALDEFAAEDLYQDVARDAGRADAVFGFECEAQPEPVSSPNGPLLDMAPAELSTGDCAERLSRIEAEHARRRTRRRSPRLRVFTNHAHQGAVAVARVLRERGHACATLVGDARRALTIGSQRRAAASRAWMKSERARFLDYAQQGFVPATRSVMELRRSLGVAKSRAFTRPFTETDLEHQEFNGLVVAVLLAVAVVGYGGFLANLWWTPDARVTPAMADAHVTRVAPSFQPRAVETLIATAPPPAVLRASVVDVSEATRPAVVRAIAPSVERRASFTPNARTLTALWQRRDTRSLDRAFATLRGETLALRRCAMRMTDVDRAVARCDGIVIDFQRTAGRWRIARVATR
jgi:hypothetical protein